MNVVNQQFDSIGLELILEQPTSKVNRETLQKTKKNSMNVS